MPRKREDVYQYKLDYELMEEVFIYVITIKIEKIIWSNTTTVDLKENVLTPRLIISKFSLILLQKSKG